MLNISVSIEPTSNTSIVKFTINQIISPDKNHEFSNVEEASISPLCKKLFFFPFIKRIFVSVNFIAVEKYNIVEWNEVQEQVQKEITNYLEKGQKVFPNQEVENKQKHISIYAESTPNIDVMKFVANKLLTDKIWEYKNTTDAKNSPLALQLFQFPFVKEVFISENFISITKVNHIEWIEITNELRSFIREYIVKNGVIVNQIQAKLQNDSVAQKDEQVIIEGGIKVKKYYTDKEKEIEKILIEYIQPSVIQDGGNIALQSFEEETGVVSVLLQGACSGCPSSQLTLKNGIEQLLKEMMPSEVKSVKAIN